MAQADANILINVITKGEQRLNAIKASINELNRLSQNLKPINLLAPGGGKLGDSLRQAIKPIQDFAREATNGTQRYSNTLAGATGQAQTFKTVLDNVKIAAGGYGKQVAAVKAYADALAGAEAQARKLAKRQKDLLTDVRRREAGLQPQSERDIEVERRRQAINNARLKQEKEISRQKAEQLRLNKLADKLEASLLSKERQRAQQLQLIENLQLGVGFPLLFGGGIGSVVGGAAGALASVSGGFGAQILFSAVGQQIDQFFADVNEAASTVAASLGQTTEALEALAEAGIVVEKSVISQIEALEEAGNTLAAYEVLQEELIRLYGEKGVTSLRNLKQANENANKAGSDLSAVLQSELAPTFTLFTDLSGDLQSALAKVVPILNKLLNPFQNADINRGDPRERARAAAQQERVDVGVRQRNIDLKLQEETDVTLNQNDSLKRAGELIDLGNDLLNDRVVLLKQVDIITKAQPEITRLDNELKEKNLTLAKKQSLEASKQNAILKRDNELAQLNADVNNKVSQENEKRAREAERAAKEALRLERAVGNERLKQNELTQKISLVGKDRLTQVREELKSLDQREALQRAVIISSTEDLRLQNEKLKTLALQFDLKEAQLRQTEKELAAQREINALKAKQETANLRRDLTQELESLALPTGDPIDDAFINLQREQEQRRANVFAGIDQAIEQQKQLLELGKITEQVYNEEIQALNNKKAAYLELLPAIEAAQTKQLVYNETLNAVQPAVNALVFGLRDVANGTKTAEQAFADFLTVIADQFFTIAARMIAQYIAIGNARNFAFGGLGGGGGGAVGGILGLLFGGAFRNGGRPEPGKVALVGENGPELFVPDGYGRIIPNGRYKIDTGGVGGAPNNITVNVDARSTDVQGDDDKSRQLGSTISRVIQAELVRQQRPGGLLYGNR